MGVLSASARTLTNIDMCLISLAYQSHPDYPLLVAANRDEYYHRPTATAQFWEDAPQLLAGRDLQAGGTWMGITRSGRFAAITNHRNPPTTPDSPRSRGMLTLDFLLGDMSPVSYLESLLPEAGRYAGFNLLLADHCGLFYFSNTELEPKVLPAGVYSLSNGLLHSRWPKQEIARQKLQSLLTQSIDHRRLQATVSSREPAADEFLPDTGVGLEMERALSPQFITTTQYGTRATTSLWVAATGEVELCEQNYLVDGLSADCATWRFSLDGRE